MKPIDLANIDIDFNDTSTGTVKADEDNAVKTTQVSPDASAASTEVLGVEPYGALGDLTEGINFVLPEIAGLEGEPGSDQDSTLFMTQMSKLFDVSSGELQEKVKIPAILLILLLSLSLIFQFDGESENPVTDLLSFFSSDDEFAFEGEEEDFQGEAEAPASGPSKQEKESQVVEEESTPKMLEAFGAVKNPYWPLPNRLTVPKVSSDGVTAAMEKRWQAGLEHRFTSQRLKSVKEMRKLKRSGSEVLLFKALDQRKFWTRMEALLALVEMGFNVDIETVDKAIGNARPSLVKNYFKRLTVEPSLAQVYVMQQAIRVVGDKTRIVILEGLYKKRLGDTNLYFAAAKSDPSKKVNAWLQNKLITRPVSQVTMLAYNKIIEDYSMGKLAFESTEPEVLDPMIDESETVDEVTFAEDDELGEEEKILSPDEEATDGFEDVIEVDEMGDEEEEVE